LGDERPILPLNSLAVFDVLKRCVLGTDLMEEYHDPLPKYSGFPAASYLGLLVNALGWALVFRSGVGVLLTALIIPPLLRGYARKRNCWVRISAANTIAIASAR
jgi:hypothetical protein